MHPNYDFGKNCVHLLYMDIYGIIASYYTLKRNFTYLKIDLKMQVDHNAPLLASVNLKTQQQ